LEIANQFLHVSTNRSFKICDGADDRRAQRKICSAHGITDDAIDEDYPVWQDLDDFGRISELSKVNMDSEFDFRRLTKSDSECLGEKLGMHPHYIEGYKLTLS
jgi:hypothetical protein